LTAAIPQTVYRHRAPFHDAVVPHRGMRHWSENNPGLKITLAHQPIGIATGLG
jgi:hypothetical protein